MKIPPPRAAAFSLVEVTLALGVAAFCLIAIFGLLPVGLKSNQAAMEQTAANGILSAVAADLRATPPQSNTSQQFSVSIPANPVTSASASALYFTSKGTFVAGSAPTNDSRYLLTITFLPAGSNANAATLVQLRVTWPATPVDPANPTADPVNAAGSAKTFIALDRN